jgi:hypothetical protein
VFDPVQHAKSYPFSPPDHGFLYEGGDWERLDPGRFDDERLEGEGRVPVLAAGSNQSPAQLKRKYGHLADAGMIPARRGVLHEFDVVYAAHLTGYGSVPATFQRSPGTAVTVFVLWLDEPQLARMHETEGNYTYDHLHGIRITLDSGAPMEQAFAYSSKSGCLNHGGACVSLREIPATGRRFQEFGQVAALALLRDRFAPGVELDDFVRQHLDDRAVHQLRTSRMGEDALPAAFARRTIAVF